MARVSSCIQKSTIDRLADKINAAAAPCELGHAGFVIVFTARYRGQNYLPVTDYMRRRSRRAESLETTQNGERP
jgi:hypothetical protein